MNQFHTQTPWMWAWRNEDDDAPASIFSMVQEGHAYAVAMCPRYQKPDQWIADAAFIVKAVNSHDELKASLAEMVGIYWGDGDGLWPPPECIRRALAVLASLEVQS